MKPTKIRNKLIYRASQNVLSKQLGSNLSKDLRKKYGKRSIRVTVGDSVKVVRGEYKGVDGKVKEVSAIKNSVTIDGIKKEKLKGGQIDVYINSSNLIITDLNTDNKWRAKKLGGTSSIKEEKVIEEKKPVDVPVVQEEKDEKIPKKQKKIQEKVTKSKNEQKIPKQSKQEKKPSSKRSEK